MGDIYALVSPGGSPGVTTTAIALALRWPCPAIVAECDPSGGDILAGLLAGHVPVGRGLTEHAVDVGLDDRAASQGFIELLIPIDSERARMLLPGLTDPRQAVALASEWPAVAATLLEQQADVIGDCGRLDAGPGQPLAVMAAARTVAIVMRPTLRQVWLARPRVDILDQLVGRSRLAIMLTGPGQHSSREISRALGIPVVATLPDDPGSAALLSDGRGAERSLNSSPLLRSAGVAGKALRDHGALGTHQQSVASGSR
jgi:hypothetical protein